MTHGLLGGICLDGYDSIPKPYDKYLHIGTNVMIKTGTILCGEGFHFTRREGKLMFPAAPGHSITGHWQRHKDRQWGTHKPQLYHRK